MGNLEKTTTAMMEYVCDSLCKHPNVVRNKEVLEEICEECRIGEFGSAILNQGNGRTDEGRKQV